MAAICKEWQGLTYENNISARLPGGFSGFERVRILAGS